MLVPGLSCDSADLADGIIIICSGAHLNIFIPRIPGLQVRGTGCLGMASPNFTSMVLSEGITWSSGKVSERKEVVTHGVQIMRCC